MIKGIRNLLKFFKVIWQWEPGWDHTEDILRKALEISRETLSDKESITRALDILERRRGYYYENYRQQDKKPTVWEVIDGESEDASEPCLVEVTPWEDKQVNEQIYQEALKLKERDFDYLLEQIKYYKDTW